MFDSLGRLAEISVSIIEGLYQFLIRSFISQVSPKVNSWRLRYPEKSKKTEKKSLFRMQDIAEIHDDHNSSGYCPFSPAPLRVERGGESQGEGTHF